LFQFVINYWLLNARSIRILSDRRETC